MFVEIIGESGLLDRFDLDRDDVEEALEKALGSDGEVTGAGAGTGRWHLDLEIETDESAKAILIRVANALVGLGLGAVRVRPEGQKALPATHLAG